MVSTAAIYLSTEKTTITLFNRKIKCESCKRKKNRRQMDRKWKLFFPLVSDPVLCSQAARVTAFSGNLF